MRRKPLPLSFHIWLKLNCWSQGQQDEPFIFFHDGVFSTPGCINNIFSVLVTPLAFINPSCIPVLFDIEFACANLLPLLPLSQCMVMQLFWVDSQHLCAADVCTSKGYSSLLLRRPVRDGSSRLGLYFVLFVASSPKIAKIGDGSSSSSSSLLPKRLLEVDAETLVCLKTKVAQIVQQNAIECCWWWDDSGR